MINNDELHIKTRWTVRIYIYEKEKKRVILDISNSA